MEKMKFTLDDMLDEGYYMSEEEWISVLFQTTFGLAVANKHYNFVHNDLHSDNIMFQDTNKTHLYYQINKTYYKIPTFGKITKIIDFARGICKYNSKWIFSDVFHPEGEAAGQYDYPKNAKSLKGCKHKPNPSFDLIRLATTIAERLDYGSPIYELIKKWCECDDGTNVLYKDDDFDLYIDIAQNCHNAVPREVLKDDVFAQFKCRKDEIPDATHIYKL
jgi:serine/threonine protein kinase